MTLAWNLVSKHIRPHEQMLEKIREKISKLELHLQHFPPDAVHLLVNLEQHARTGVFSVALTLRLPSNILRSEKQNKNSPISAFDIAVRALLRELEDLKAELRREHAWRHKGRRVELQATKPLRFTDEPQSNGPQSLTDLLAEMIKRYHGRLLFHVQRQLQRDQLAGDVPVHAIKAEVIVDEVVRQALNKPESKPEDLSYRMWLHSLARRELKRRYRRYLLDGERNLPIEERTTLAEEDNDAQGYNVEEPLAIIQTKLEPPLVTRGDLIADEHEPGPDAIAAEHDLIDYLHRTTSAWPERERAVFDLHFLEGFDADEVAMLESMPPAEASAMIDAVQLRLRGLLLNAADRLIVARVQSVAPA